MVQLHWLGSLLAGSYSIQGWYWAVRAYHKAIAKSKKTKTPKQAHANFLNADQIGLFRQMIRLGLKGVWPRWGFAEKEGMTRALAKMDAFLEMTGKGTGVSFSSITQDL